MNTTANSSYLLDRRAKGFDTNTLSPANVKAYEMLDELTEGFTDMDMISADESFEKTLDLLVQSIKASSAPKMPSKKPLTDKQKKQAATVKAKGAGVKTAKKTRSADAATSFSERMQKAKARKQAETKQTTDSSSKTSAPRGKKSTKRTAGTKEKSVKPKPPTKADQAQAQYESAEKVGTVAEEIRHIKSFIGLVKKSTQEQIVNACKRLQRAFTTRKIRKTSDLATEVKEVEAAYIEAARKSPYKIKVSDDRLAHYVQLVGGQKVYKSIELVNKFIGWGQTERTAEQVKKFLTEIKNASGKVKAGDPYADQVKQIIRKLEGVKAKSSFTLDKTSLSGLSGVMGCLCHEKGVSGTGHNAHTKTEKTATLTVKGELTAHRSAKKSLSGLDETAPAGTPERDRPTGTEGTSPIGLVTKPRWPATMSAHQVMAIDYPTYAFRDDPTTNDWGSLFGRPQNPFSAMFSGSPGAGKSTLLMQLSVYLAKNFGETLYISSEEYPSFTLADKLERAGGAVKGLDFAKSINEIRRQHKFVIIDSSTHLSLTLKEFIALKERFPNTSFILILQYTKSGQFRGGNEWPHEVDAVFFIDGGVVNTTKNRFVRDFATINVFKH